MVRVRELDGPKKTPMLPLDRTIAPVRVSEALSLT